MSIYVCFSACPRFLIKEEVNGFYPNSEELKCTYIALTWNEGFLWISNGLHLCALLYFLTQY